MNVGGIADEWRTDDLLDVVVVGVDLVCLGKDDLGDAGCTSGVDDPKILDIHLGSKSLDILQDDVLVLVNPAS